MLVYDEWPDVQIIKLHCFLIILGDHDRTENYPTMPGIGRFLLHNRNITQMDVDGQQMSITKDWFYRCLDIVLYWSSMSS